MQVRVECNIKISCSIDKNVLIRILVCNGQSPETEKQKAVLGKFIPTFGNHITDFKDNTHSKYGVG